MNHLVIVDRNRRASDKICFNKIRERVVSLVLTLVFVVGTLTLFELCQDEIDLHNHSKYECKCEDIK